MDELRSIQNEITRITTIIETEYPELYPFLEELTITLPDSDHPTINVAIMNSYLDNLKTLLLHYIETHKNN